MEKEFMILAIRLLAAILAAQNSESRRAQVVLKDADKWVSERQQNAGLPQSMDWCEK